MLLTGRSLTVFCAAALLQGLTFAAGAGATQNAVDVRWAAYGAKCDWDGTRGTDDTAAFQAAAAAASNHYRETGKSVEVRIGKSCELASTVTFGSGVHWIGPGTIYVPKQTQQVLQALNADDVSVAGVTIDVLDEDCGSNNATCAAISWRSTSSDTQAHAHLSVRDNTIYRSNWGILVGYAAGTGSLSDVEIVGNTVSSPSPYTDADAIHVGGRVHHFRVTGNRVFNRGDAGVAASSEPGDYLCSDGIIEDNVLIDDQVGLDNSACTNTLWKRNFVRATFPPRGSNPAFRCISYLGLTSFHVTVSGNYLQNAAGTGEYAAKVDEIAARSRTNAFLWGNTIASPLALYLRGASIEIAGNTFKSDAATLTVDYDGKLGVPSQFISIGRNRWLSSGSIQSGDNAGLLRDVNLDAQSATAPLVYTGRVNPKQAGRGDHARRDIQTSAGTLRGEAIVDRPHQLEAGFCYSVDTQVHGAVPNMSATIADTGALHLPENLVSWAFVRSANVVTVRTCAVKMSMLPAVHFGVVAE